MTYTYMRHLTWENGEVNPLPREVPWKAHLTPSVHGGAIFAFTENGEFVGHLKWYKADNAYQCNQIAMVHVEPDHRRKGVATQMWREAQKANPDIRHSTVRTRDGDPWAKATGDEIPVRGTKSCSCCPERRSNFNFTNFVEDTIHKIRHETKELV